MADSARNPLIDPLPGDVVESQAERDQLHVHRMRDGQVYCGKWSADGRSLGLVRGSIEQWRRDCATAGARVIQRHEDCPTEILADLAYSGVREFPEVKS